MTTIYLRSQSYFVVSCAVLTYQVFIDYIYAYVTMLSRCIGHVHVGVCLNAVLFKFYGTPGSTRRCGCALKGNVVVWCPQRILKSYVYMTLAVNLFTYQEQHVLGDFLSIGCICIHCIFFI